MANHSPKPEDFVGMREGARLTQAGAAEMMGIDLAEYQALETPDARPGKLHALAFERSLMDLAIRDGDVGILPVATLAVALRLTELAGHDLPADEPDPALMALEARRASILADLAPVDAALEAYRAQASRRGNASKP